MFENRRNLRIWSSSPPHIRLHIGILALYHWKFSRGVAAPFPQAKQACDEKCPPFLLSVPETQASLALSFPGFSVSFFRVQVQSSLPHPKTRSCERIGESANLQARVMQAQDWSSMVTRQNGQIRRFRRFSIIWSATFQP